MALTREEKDEILTAIDRGAWKYSWHLKLDSGRNIDFSNTENLEKIVSVLESERSFGIGLAFRSEKLLDVVGKQLTKCKEREAEEAIEELIALPPR